MTVQLRYLSDRVVTNLKKNKREFIARYRGDGFQDLANDPGWDVPLGIEYDEKKLAALDVSKPQRISEIDLINSKAVGEALCNLDPSTANEERIWVRLAHIEAFEYAKARWLDATDDERLLKQVNDHFFAGGQTGIRDDHALSRLWWNYEIARRCAPDDIDAALELILRSADIRSNFVERIWMTSRRSIAGAVLRAMKEDAWVTSGETNFRQFMKSLNRLGGGVVFEVLDENETNDFVGLCVAAAKAA